MGDKGPEGPPVDGGGVMPYEPFSNIIGHDAVELVNTTVYCNQFVAPTSGNYTHLTFQTSKNSSSNFVGKIGCAIYTNAASPTYDTASNIGVPGTKIAQGILDVPNDSSIDLRRTYLNIPFKQKYQIINKLNAEITDETKKWLINDMKLEVPHSLRKLAMLHKKKYMLVETTGQKNVQPLHIRIKQSNTIIMHFLKLYNIL